MKKSILFLIIIFFSLSIGCVKEPAESTSAEFYTSLTDNRVALGVEFTVYFDKTEGDFVTYFAGDSEETTYNPDDYTVKGVAVNEQPSVDISYNKPGTKVFTVVATSVGDWAEEIKRDVKSITIEVVE